MFLSFPTSSFYPISFFSSLLFLLSLSYSFSLSFSFSEGQRYSHFSWLLWQRCSKMERVKKRGREGREGREDREAVRVKGAGCGDGCVEGCSAGKCEQCFRYFTDHRLCFSLSLSASPTSPTTIAPSSLHIYFPLVIFITLSPSLLLPLSDRRPSSPCGFKTQSPHAAVIVIIIIIIIIGSFSKHAGIHSNPEKWHWLLGEYQYRQASFNIPVTHYQSNGEAVAVTPDYK